MQAGGHRFDPGTLHHFKLKVESGKMKIKRLTEAAKKFEVSLSFLKEKLNSRKGSGTDPEETKETERGHKTAMHLEN